MTMSIYDANELKRRMERDYPGCRVQIMTAIGEHEPYGIRFIHHWTKDGQPELTDLVTTSPGHWRYLEYRGELPTKQSAPALENINALPITTGRATNYRRTRSNRRGGNIAPRLPRKKSASLTTRPLDNWPIY